MSLCSFGGRLVSSGVHPSATSSSVDGFLILPLCLAATLLIVKTVTMLSSSQNKTTTDTTICLCCTSLNWDVFGCHFIYHRSGVFDDPGSSAGSSFSVTAKILDAWTTTNISSSPTFQAVVAEGILLADRSMRAKISESPHTHILKGLMAVSFALATLKQQNTSFANLNFRSYQRLAASAWRPCTISSCTSLH